MQATGVDHLNVRVPKGRLDEYTDFYESIGFELDGYEAYRDGERSFFYVRFSPSLVFHVTPQDSVPPRTGERINHVAVFVEQPRSEVKDRLADAGANIVDVATREGATGTYPSVYVEDPAGYTVEFKSPVE